VNPETYAALLADFKDLYGQRPPDDETVDPDVADYVRAATEGLEEG
jgi:hypothetical protein